jgi:hypothetical protein
MTVTLYLVIVSFYANGCLLKAVWTYLGVSNFQRAMSMVIPRSRSDFSLSKTQAYLKEPLPSSAASYDELSVMCSGRSGWRAVCPSRDKFLAKPSQTLSRIATRRGDLVGRRDCIGDQTTWRRKSAHLLELLDGTLVNSTALVDQVCDICESLCSNMPGAGSRRTYDRWWSTFRSRRGR